MIDQLFSFNHTISVGFFSVTFTLSSIVEILLFAVLFYYIVLWFRRTQAWNLIKGAGILLVVYIIAKALGLENLAFVFENFVGSLVLALIIILQPEIRKALENLGNRKINAFSSSGEKGYVGGLTDDSLKEITSALGSLSRNRIGALITFERDIDLADYIDSGIALDSKISSQLVEQIFEHNTPLHDGAVIIRNNRIDSATCYFPLSQDTSISKELGTRHRAGLGVSEVSDSITVIVSEETGSISVARHGSLERNVTVDRVRTIIQETGSEDDNPSILNRMLRRRKTNG